MNAIAEKGLELLEPEDLTPQPVATPQSMTAPMQQYQQPARQLSVVEYAMQNGASAADVKALVELQIQMDEHRLAMMRSQDEREREQRKVAAELAYLEALAGFRGENIIIPKAKHIDRGRAGSFSQAEFDGVCRLLSPALSKYGLSFRHDQKFGTKAWPTPENPNNVTGWVWVTCYLRHKGGHGETLELEGPPDDQSANTPVQNMQSTASFLKRQSLLSITGTATGGEDTMRGSGMEPGAHDDARQALIDAGRAQAMLGMKALTEWWRVRSPREQKDLQLAYGSMRKAAIDADRGVKHEQ